MAFHKVEHRLHGHHITLFLLPSDQKSSHGGLAAVASMSVRRLSAELCLLKKRPLKNSQVNEDDIRVKCYMLNMGKAWPGRHTLRLYGPLPIEVVSILV